MRLPDAPPVGRRAAVRVSNDALRQIRGGHPWVFDRSIRSVSTPPSTGDLVVVFDDRRRFAAIGLWDQGSPIRIRILHAGEPTPVDATFFEARLALALELREPLIAREDTSGYRLVHGENDGLPGLVVDEYGHTLVVKLYSAAWWPHLGQILEALVDLRPPERVVVRLSRLVARELAGSLRETQVVFGPDPDGPVAFRENGLRFGADVMVGQKTGHFLDQRDNRAELRSLSGGARVLDMFCHTGGFSVHAAAGGAESVLAVDRSGPALAAVEAHLSANLDLAGVRTCRHDTLRADAFAALADMSRRGRRFDVVVIDPPSFASRRHEVEPAVRAYRKLAELGASVVAEGGMLVQASCSSRVTRDRFVATVEGALRSSGRDHEVVTVTGHCLDHPITYPQGRYLKAVFAQL